MTYYRWVKEDCLLHRQTQYVWVVLAAMGVTGGIHGDSTFGTDLYRKTAVAGGNLVFSPTGIAAPLKMVLVGARGQTADELAFVLHMHHREDAIASLAQFTSICNENLMVANSIWLDSRFSVRQEYASELARFAVVRRCDFSNSPESAREEINSLVAAQTGNAIMGVIPPGTVERTTRSVLVNATYLDSLWANPFPGSGTRRKSFYPEGGGVAPCMFMHLEAMLWYYRNSSYQVVVLPYKDSSLAMVMVLPDAPLSMFVMSPEFDGGIGELFSKVMDGREKRLVALGSPRFRISREFEVTNVLRSLGAQRAFTADADLGGITAERLSISAVIHKAYIDVTEKGTKAAAATAATARLVSRRVTRTPDTELMFDRPFLFAIFDTASQLPVFLGQYTHMADASSAI